MNGCQDNDLHVVPTFAGERDHETSPTCWCVPEIDSVADDGARLWVHRREQ